MYARLFSIVVAVLLIVVSGVADAAIVADDFESASLGAAPSAGNGWSTLNTSALQTVDVIAAQSPFGAVGDSQAVRIYDGDSAAALNPTRLRNSTSTTLATDAPFIIQFDYRLQSLSQLPVFQLMNSGNASVAILFGMVYTNASNDIYWTDSGGLRHVIGSAVLNDWYRVTMTIDPIDSAIDGWSLRLERHDGASIVSDQTFENLTFRSEASGLGEMRWLFNQGVGTLGGDFVIDNFVVDNVTMIPAPAALPAGLCLLLSAIFGRRR